ncbi:hybrid sensor histidine kinase/response regulator [bacterium]|nr:hybrid sensor histidine kinase/response regulator [bacterium]
MKSDFKILIVDDIIQNIEIIKTFLEDVYILDSAESGEEALEKVPVFQPDLILLDIKMPGMDGYEVCKTIRQNEEYNHIRIMMVSALTMIEERLKGYETGADDYITKPFVVEELEAKINVFLNLKRTTEIDKLKSDLLALFSHETRTPLNTIIGISSLLMEDEDLDEETRRSISMIQESGNQLHQFVEKTSFLCELKSLQGIEKRKEQVLSQLKNVIASMGEAIAAKEIQMEHDTTTGFPVNGDWYMIYEVLTYLLDNAIKFSPEKGTITVAQRQEGENGIITISDQGPGIQKDWLSKIFDEFAIQDIMHHQKGQGLSLAIAKHVMRLHNGFITAENNPDRGVTFSLGFPLG